MVALNQRTRTEKADSRAKRRTSVTIDVDALQAVQEMLGTEGITETINAALHELIARKKRAQLAKLMWDDQSTDIRNPEIMAKAWRR